MKEDWRIPPEGNSCVLHPPKRMSIFSITLEGKVYKRSGHHNETPKKPEVTNFKCQFHKENQLDTFQAGFKILGDIQTM